MNGKRKTIYHIAEELGMSASYVSRALNDYPSVSQDIKDKVKKKAAELNYKHNSHAANLRQGSSKTIGVIVPYINHSFFSDAIAGIEEACFASNHSLIICQSHESYQQECMAIDTLVHQNVDCIIISVSAETQSAAHLETIKEHNIELVQFDRCIDNLESFKVINDNRDISFKVVNTLIESGYKRIAFIGGPEHLTVFRERKEGYLKAIRKAGLTLPANFIADNALKEKAGEVARKLLSLPDPPDAFFTVSDHQSVEVLRVAHALQIEVPQHLGIFGFANEAFSSMVSPALSSVDQKSKEIGKCAANLYFESVAGAGTPVKAAAVKVIGSEIIIRKSSEKRKTKEFMDGN